MADSAFPGGWASAQFAAMHAGLAGRDDLPAEPLDHCPAMVLTGENVEWLNLQGDAEAGAVIPREIWPPMWRDITRSLRVEKSRVTSAISRFHNGDH
jgi:hypothetical protein